MAPKQKPQTKQRHAGKPVKQQGSGTKTAPKLQISAENERRLRRLLMNNERPTSVAGPDADEGISREQKARKLRNIYDKLSLEGFTPEQIERALSAIAEGATFESALDWLCFNLPGDELPMKFSNSGSISAAREVGEESIKVISRAQEDWIPSELSKDIDEEKFGLSIRIKGKQEESLMDIGDASQADWIRQYMKHQEEEEQRGEEEKEKQLEEELDDGILGSSVVKEYHLARSAALEAKRKGDKKSQEHLSSIIRKLKQEIASLGLSGELYQFDSAIVSMDNTQTSAACKLLDSELQCNDDTHGGPHDSTFESGIASCRDGGDHYKFTESECAVDSSTFLDTLGPDTEKEEPDIPQLDDLFSEDVASAALPAEITNIHKKDNALQFAHAQTLKVFDAVWKKGDNARFPKAVLQKICQQLGWEAPKYNKILERGDKCLYSVSILRTASGRGKSRKAGGLITLQLPEQDQSFGSVEDAQNKVATFALYQLFPDFPVHELLIEPYSSCVRKWQEGGLGEAAENEEARRANFVDALLKNDTSVVSSSSVGKDSFLYEELVEPSCERKSDTGIRHMKDAECIFLKQELKNRRKMPNYVEMQKARGSLPIAVMKNQILQLLKENDVLVVCGETGCGKTTQVPQYILDSMIESGEGGYCNIVCTQPRRIAAISVAERVSEERCESSPGCGDSLVGFQVRLESARNMRTKLLFCTTGILLRRLSADKDLVGVTHVIVDEVHERSLLGDFLLIVLKNLVDRQAASGKPKLKVILMSATVDSSLFSKYFSNCPVITAEGRTYPVTPYFLEDIYEKLNYCLSSDSPASGVDYTSTRKKSGEGHVDHKRGKKNLVLSSWGDEALLNDEYVNPHYSASLFKSYSDRTCQNLKKLNEDVIDYDLLEDLIYYIDESCPPGAILVFLPGVAEIYLLVDKLCGSHRFGGASSEWILPLHSSLSSKDQRKVFLSPPCDFRKVIVATDIAETSITIDDITYVIDSGKHKENHYNPRKKMSSIIEDWISRANAKQRRGRAGRVKPGLCFCLYTRHRFEKIMRSFQVPEMLRMPLTELCLQIKSLDLGDIKSFLLKAIEPPSEDAISSAVSALYEVGAIENDEKMTPLGYHLAKLPVDVPIGKMLLYGAIFGCLSPTLSIASYLSYKSPFVYPKDEKESAERSKLMLLTGKVSGTDGDEGAKQSDQLLVALAYNKWAKVLHEEGAKAANHFCRLYFLSSSVMYTMRDMRMQFGELLADIGLINLPTNFSRDKKMKDKLDRWFADSSQPFNMYSLQNSIVKAIVCAGLFPNVAATEEGIAGPSQGSTRSSSSGVSMKEKPLWFDKRREVHIHPSSVISSIKEFRYPFLVFLEKVETSKVFVRDISIISPYCILLFGGSINIQHQTGLVTIDGWLKLTSPAQTAVLFKELRLTLHSVLKELIRKPKVETVVNNEVVRSIIHLLLEEDKP